MGTSTVIRKFPADMFFRRPLSPCTRQLSLLLGMCSMLLSLLLAFVRVLGGVHYPRMFAMRVLGLYLGRTLCYFLDEQISENWPFVQERVIVYWRRTWMRREDEVQKAEKADLDQGGLSKQYSLWDYLFKVIKDLVRIWNNTLSWKMMRTLVRIFVSTISAL